LFVRCDATVPFGGGAALGHSSEAAALASVPRLRLGHAHPYPYANCCSALHWTSRGTDSGAAMTAAAILTAPQFDREIPLLRLHSTRSNCSALALEVRLRAATTCAWLQCCNRDAAGQSSRSDAISSPVRPPIDRPCGWMHGSSHREDSTGTALDVTEGCGVQLMQRAASCYRLF